MLYNSYVFIFAFLPAVLAGYALLRRQAEQSWVIVWLVSASLFYYGWWKPQFLLLLFVSVGVNALFGKSLIEGGHTRRRARLILMAGIAFNVGLLLYFKYAMFILENLNMVFGADIGIPKIVLPIGISFITFQKIAFLVDAYRGLVPRFSLRNYALFVTFFPQLIAGPIVHHSEMMPQFERGAVSGSLRQNIAIGMSIFIVGLFKKVIIADGCATYANLGFGALATGEIPRAATAWVAIVAYTFQLYYDFSGYSDMATGLARMFGIAMPANFHSPYKASGIIDFWRRWHITLSRFLRDYLYIPLGGNRAGELRRFLNLSIVMLIGGLWHGANWTFVVWGGVHGILLGINHTWTRSPLSRSRIFDSRPATVFFIGITFVAVAVAWVPFRAESMEHAWRMLCGLAGAGASEGGMTAADRRFGALWIFVVGMATFLLPNSNQLFSRFNRVVGVPDSWLDSPRSLRGLDWRVAAILSGAFVWSVLHLARVSPFLYFQF